MIASELPPVRSGVARAAGRLAEGFASRGHELRYLSAADAWHRHFGEYRISALGLRWLDLRSAIGDAELVHLTGPAPFIADAFLARWRWSDRSVPLVYTHGFTVELDHARRISAVYGRLHDRLLAAADAVVATTPSYGALLEPRVPGRVHVIPWGLDDVAVRGSIAPSYDGRRKLRVLFVGQQRPYKGIPVLIEAVRALGRVELTIVGGGPKVDEYRELSRRAGSHIRHLGPVGDGDLAELYESNDVIVLPSTNRSEAFGLVLLEGMAAGCVAVASRLPGVVDVVGSAGLTVPPGDAVALRAALAELAADPLRVVALQTAAVDHARSFRWEEAVDSYCSLFYSVACGQRGRFARSRA